MTSNLSIGFDFEANFNSRYHVQWFSDHRSLPFCSITLYIAAIFFIQVYMKTRAPRPLRSFLFIWNYCLAIFSIVGALRSLSFHFRGVSTLGFYTCTCKTSELIEAAFFWAWLFSLSKFVELGDTLFIVLRKQRLTFLHVYHHVTVLFASWYSFGELSAPTIWFSSMNYAVHSVMYSYYALRSLRVKVPRWISMVITSGQIMQMFIGFSVCIYTYIVRARGFSCDISQNLLRYMFLVYGSYIVLFCNFFRKAYLFPKDGKKAL